MSNNSALVTCYACQGTGRLILGKTHSTPCDRCHGTGRVLKLPPLPCLLCKGTGLVPRAVTKSADIGQLIDCPECYGTVKEQRAMRNKNKIPGRRRNSRFGEEQVAVGPLVVSEDIARLLPENTTVNLKLDEKTNTVRIMIITSEPASVQTLMRMHELMQARTDRHVELEAFVRKPGELSMVKSHHLVTGSAPGEVQLLQQSVHNFGQSVDLIVGSKENPQRFHGGKAKISIKPTSGLPIEINSIEDFSPITFEPIKVRGEFTVGVDAAKELATPTKPGKRLPQRFQDEEEQHELRSEPVPVVQSEEAKYVTFVNGYMDAFTNGSEELEGKALILKSMQEVLDDMTRKAKEKFPDPPGITSPSAKAQIMEALRELKMEDYISSLPSMTRPPRHVRCTICGGMIPAPGSPIAASCTCKPTY